MNSKQLTNEYSQESNDKLSDSEDFEKNENDGNYNPKAGKNTDIGYVNMFESKE